MALKRPPINESISVDKDFELVYFTPPSPSVDALDASVLFSDESMNQSYHVISDVTVSEFKESMEEKLPDFVAFRCKPLNKESFRSFFDSAGRLVDEHAFKTAVFRGGCEVGIRPEVWLFLYSLYPAIVTLDERNILKRKKMHLYNALKKRWKKLIFDKYPSFDINQPDNYLMDDRPAYESFTNGNNNCDCKEVESLELSNKSSFDIYNVLPDADQLAKLEADLVAQRTNFDYEFISESLRHISKDVLRTERSHEYFAGDQNPHLIALRDVLLTFCILNQDIGYVQGMNDLLARFFVVLDSEPLAFWCFNNYIESIRDEFSSQGMVRKVSLMSSLLKRLDPKLHNFLESRNLSDLIFCHKWLLLCFQREFDLNDGLRLLEIIGTRLVGHNTQLALKIMDDCRKKTQDIDVNVECEMAQSDYTFDLFISVAILLLNRSEIMQDDLDDSDVLQMILQSPKTTKLDDVLNEAEKLFYLFCRRSVLYSF